MNRYQNKTDAIILNLKNYKEVDKIITFYTSEFGKIKIKAKGVQKITSKLNSSLQPFNLLEIFFVKGRLFPVLAECVVKERLISYEGDFKKIAYGMYLLDVLNSLTEEGSVGKHYEPFNLILSSLREINHKNNKDIVCFSFITKLLTYLGYKPVFDCCVRCKKSVTDKILKFSFQEGGIICEKCSLQDTKIENISYDGVKFLYSLMDEEKYKTEVSFEVKNEVDKFLDMYIYHLTGKVLKSKSFLLY